MSTEALVLSPREAAALLGVSHQTMRRWVADGAAPNAFAHLPGTRIGVPRWWVDQIVTGAGVVAAPEAGAAGSLSVVRRNDGGPTNRTADGSNPSAA